jgi:hypothetical protein
MIDGNLFDKLVRLVLLTRPLILLTFFDTGVDSASIEA